MSVTRLLHLLPVLLLFACGEKKSALKLEVTKSFLNSNFSGSLYIHGKNTSTGEEFSFSIPSQQAASVLLNFGKWDIRAIGWENSTSGAFEGTANCGYQQVDFKTDGQSAGIMVANANCDDPMFANSYSISSGGTKDFKNLTVAACGALYDPANTNQLLPAILVTPTICTSYPQPMFLSPRGLKITLHNKLPGQPLTSGISSRCVGITSGVFSSTLNLPTKIPVTVSLFEDDACTSSAFRYHFPLGIDHSLPRTGLPFDSVYGTGAMPTLAIALPLSLRGTTPFLTETPIFRCNSSSPKNCATFPPKISGSSFVVTPREVYIQLSQETDCLTAAFQSTDGNNDNQFDVQKLDCYPNPRTGLTVLKLLVEDRNADYDTSFLYNGTSYQIAVRSSLWPVKDLAQILGYETSANDVSLSNIEVRKNEAGDKKNGIAGDLGDLLSPNLLGGLFWDQVCSTTTLSSTMKRSITFNEDGTDRSYLIILTNPPATSSQTTSTATFSLTGTVATSMPIFHRRLIIRRFINSVGGYRTETVLDFGCDNDGALNFTTNSRLGRLEELHYDTEGTNIRTERRLAFWDTSKLESSWIERYQLETNIDIALSPSLQRESTSVTRIEKVDDGAGQISGRVSELSYWFETNKQQRLHHRNFDFQGSNVTLSDAWLERPAQNYWEIFNSSALEEKLRVRLGPETKDAPAVAMHSSGKTIRALNLNGDFKVEHFDGVNTTAVTVTGFSPVKAVSDYSPDGTVAIATALDSIGNINLQRFSQGTFTWANSNTSSTPLDFDAAVNNNGDIILARVDASMQLSIAFGNLLTNGYFDQGPNTINLTDPELAQINEVEVTTDDQGKFRLFIIGSYLNNNIPMYKLSTCTVSIASQVCSPEPLISSQVSVIQMLRSTSPDSGAQVIASVANMAGQGQELTFSVRWVNGVYQTATNGFAGLNSMGKQTTNFSMTSYTTPTNPVILTPQFPAPKATGFRMNFMALRPDLMSGLFTSQSTFEDIGSGL